MELESIVVLASIHALLVVLVVRRVGINLPPPIIPAVHSAFTGNILPIQVELARVLVILVMVESMHRVHQLVHIDLLREVTNVQFALLVNIPDPLQCNAPPVQQVHIHQVSNLPRAITAQQVDMQAARVRLHVMCVVPENMAVTLDKHLPTVVTTVVVASIGPSPGHPMRAPMAPQVAHVNLVIEVRIQMVVVQVVVRARLVNISKILVQTIAIHVPQADTLLAIRARVAHVAQTEGISKVEGVLRVGNARSAQPTLTFRLIAVEPHPLDRQSVLHAAEGRIQALVQPIVNRVPLGSMVIRQQVGVKHVPPEDTPIALE